MATYLAFAIKEFADAKWVSDKNITELAFVAYNTANISTNCTFNWTSTTGSPINVYQSKNCGSASTTKVTDFLTFNAVNIYYSNVLYYSINPTTAAQLGWKPADFFGGKSTNYLWDKDSTFVQITALMTGTNSFSTVKAKLFIVRFQGDYSYLTGTVVDSAGKTACTLIFTGLNEAVCQLAAGASTDSPAYSANYTIMMKKNTTVVFKYPFARYFEVGTGTYAQVKETVDRFICPYIIPGVTPPDYNIKSNEILTTTFYINLDQNVAKTATPDLTNVTCPYVEILVMSNGSAIFNGSNYASDALKTAEKGFCYVPVSSNTNSLVPFTDFIVNATLKNGTNYVYTKAKLTPRMISNWAENALGNGTIVVAFADINKSGLTGGEVAAIVIGSCAGVMVLALLATLFIRWCAYGCMAPEMVAAPKMMM